MYLIYSFLFCGFICFIAQLILDHTKLSPGHITSIFVCFGAFLDLFGLYDVIIQKVGGGALLPITSFGHSLIHGSMSNIKKLGVISIFDGMFDFTATGIVAAIVFSFVFSILFRPKD